MVPDTVTYILGGSKKTREIIFKFIYIRGNEFGHKFVQWSLKLILIRHKTPSFPFHFPMRTPATNQRRRIRRPLRNTVTPPPTNQRRAIVFTPKLKYNNSGFNEDGVFVVTKRKRALPTETEKEVKRQKQLQIKINHVRLSELQWKVVGFYQHGAYMENYRFTGGPKSSKTIIRFLQETYPQYAKYNAAKSFYYAAIKKFEKRMLTPEFDPFRERRGENRTSPKRKNPEIVTLIDEALSEEQITAPKIRRELLDLGHRISLSTIYRIVKDLFYRWQKPWYTDVLTPAQKLKRKLFCAQLLRLSEEELLRKIAEWMFTDEKWWDIVGPAMYKYVKAGSKAEAKNGNKVLISFFCFVLFFVIYLFALCLHRRHHDTKAKRAASKGEFTFGEVSLGGVRLAVKPGLLPTTPSFSVTQEICASARCLRMRRTTAHQSSSGWWRPVRVERTTTFTTCDTSISPTRTRHVPNGNTRPTRR